MSVRRPNLRLALLVLLLLTAAGTAGYMLIERWSFFDALYMTVTTLATVGYGEVHPMDLSGRLFTILFILIGVGTTLYVLTTVVVFVVEGQLGQTVGRRRMERAIARLDQHFIICGYGRVGQEIAQEFGREHLDFVVVDIN